MLWLRTICSIEVRLGCLHVHKLLRQCKNPKEIGFSICSPIQTLLLRSAHDLLLYMFYHKSQISSRPTVSNLQHTSHFAPHSNFWILKLLKLVATPKAALVKIFTAFRAVWGILDRSKCCSWTISCGGLSSWSCICLWNYFEFDDVIKSLCSCGICLRSLDSLSGSQRIAIWSSLHT